MEGRLIVFLKANSNMAYSGLELLSRFGGLFIPKWFKVWWALANLESEGYIESKRIGWKRYYALTRKGNMYLRDKGVAER